MSKKEFYLSSRILRKAAACSHSHQLFIQLFGLVAKLTRQNFNRWMQTLDRQVRINDVRWLIEQIDSFSRTQVSKKKHELGFYQADWFDFRKELDSAWRLSDDELYAFLVRTVTKWHKIRTRLSIPSIEDL